MLTFDAILFLKGDVLYSRISKKIYFHKNDHSRGEIMRKIDCAHRKILKKFSGGQKMKKIASKLGVISFNPNKIIFRGKFVRGIDCAP